MTIDKQTIQQATNDLRHEIINDVIGIEGCYVDDQLDSGGKTKYGITQYTASEFGLDVKTLTIADAYRIYEQKYWHKNSLDRIVTVSPLVAHELFDTAVNLGSSAKFLQRCLNVLNQKARIYPDLLVDGIIGSATVSAFKTFLNQRGKEGENVLLNMLNVLQGNYYIRLAERREKDERFIYGWFKNRIGIN